MGIRVLSHRRPSWCRPRTGQGARRRGGRPARPGGSRPRRSPCRALVVHVQLLWNTHCPGAAVAQLGAEGHDIKDDDVARLSSLENQHIDLRPLRLRVPLRRARPGPAPSAAPGRRRRRG
ncbi:Tn3 family transposase [Streptomyces sp. NPDC005571]|uniref:Tn3 family transposase n=1 Tax=Streptomyces sp. NPDC005571 TaxID=3156888 RepID=UPI0033A5E169